MTLRKKSGGRFVHQVTGRVDVGDEIEVDDDDLREHLLDHGFEEIVDVSSDETDEESSEDSPLDGIPWQTAVSDIEDGKYDDQLEAVIDHDKRDSVVEAARDRSE